VSQIINKIGDPSEIVLRNLSQSPEIVLVFPVTDDNLESRIRWEKVVNTIDNSAITTLVLIDKTDSKSPSKFFQDNFAIHEKSLIILGRSKKDTLFDSLGEISLSENMWIIQLHDDDNWEGIITLPQTPRANTVYIFNYFVEVGSNKRIEMFDFTNPNRIVFSLVPAQIWNKFSRYIRDQEYHVAGAFDYILNFMAQKHSEFEHIDHFNYYWRNHNWESGKKARAHLIGLTRNDGWNTWSTPEIALFNRTMDCIVSLNYIVDELSVDAVDSEVKKFINTLRINNRKSVKVYGTIVILYVSSILRRLNEKFKAVKVSKEIDFSSQINHHLYLLSLRNITSLAELRERTQYLQTLPELSNLKKRFEFWELMISKLESKRAGS
jgi:hypothetical protein